MPTIDEMIDSDDAILAAIASRLETHGAHYALGYAEGLCLSLAAHARGRRAPDDAMRLAGVVGHAAKRMESARRLISVFRDLTDRLMKTVESDDVLFEGIEAIHHDCHEWLSRHE